MKIQVVQKDHPEKLHDLIEAHVSDRLLQAIIIHAWSHHGISHEIGDDDADKSVIGNIHHGELQLDVLKLGETPQEPTKICFGRHPKYRVYCQVSSGLERVDNISSCPVPSAYILIGIRYLY
jgi:hypothetical protein